MMQRFSAWAEDVVSTLLPGYRAAPQRDRVTYRPFERTLTQGLHVDTSCGRPSRGRAMLRIFCNINAANRPRVWQVGESFEPLGAMSGQHSLDQTFFLPAAAMRDPSRSSLRILERLTGRPLV